MHFTLQNQPRSYGSLSEPAIGEVVIPEAPSADAFDIKLRKFAYAAFIALTLNMLFLLLLTQIHHDVHSNCCIDRNDVIESDIYDDSPYDVCISGPDEDDFLLVPDELLAWDLPADEPQGPLVTNAMLMSAACLDALPPDRRQHDE